MEDPAFLAFLRMSGVSEANLRNEIIFRTEAAQRAVNRAAAGYEQQKAQAGRNIGLSFEDRGLGNSGEQFRQQGESAAGIDYNRQSNEAQSNDALSLANMQAQNSLAELAQKRVEEEMAARERVGAKRAQQTYNPTGA